MLLFAGFDGIYIRLHKLLHIWIFFFQIIMYLHMNDFHNCVSVTIFYKDMLFPAFIGFIKPF